MSKIAVLLFVPARWAFKQNMVLKSLTIGVINGFLPCGWLYIFILGSVATHDPLLGSGLLVFFWLGTAPALTLFPFVYKFALSRMPKKLHQIAGVILIIAGLTSITFHTISLVDPAQHMHHMQM